MRRLDSRARDFSVEDFIVDKSDFLNKPNHNPRQKHLRVRKRKSFFKATFFGILVSIFVGIFITLAILWQQGIIHEKYVELKQKAFHLTAQMGLQLKDILVEGRNETSKDDLLKAIGLQTGDPILAFDPKRAKTEIEALPWVSQVSIERRLPDSLYVTITEKKPIALWQYQEQLSLIDSNGANIPNADRQKYKNLPLIVGEDAPQFAPALFDILESESHLKPMIASAVIVGKRRWDIHLKNGMIVKLPEKNAPAAWTQLALLDQEHKLLDRDIAIIDFRLPDRLIIKMKSSDTPNETMLRPSKDENAKKQKARLNA
jgi:cell division protein FtsQ